MPHYRSVFISDVHLGTPDCQAEYLLDFLDKVHCDTLYLVGDIVDLIAMQRRVHFPKSHEAVVHRLLAIAANLAIVAYGLVAVRYPIAAFGGAILIVNAWRLWEMRRLVKVTRAATAAGSAPITADWLLPYMRPLALPADTVLFRKGDAADAMYAERIKRIVVAERVFDAGAGDKAQDAADQAHEDGIHRRGEPGGGGDDDQPGDRAGDRAQHGGFAGLQPFGKGPAKSARGGGEMGGNERAARQRAGRESAAGVEPKPANPQQRCADDRKDDAVRRHGHFAEAAALAEICSIFPDFDPATGRGYAPAARRTLRPYEAQAFRPAA